MAKEKKRGFFSWLGFGRDEEQQPAEEDKGNSKPPADAVTEEHTAVENSAREVEPSTDLNEHAHPDATAESTAPVIINEESTDSVSIDPISVDNAPLINEQAVDVDNLQVTLVEPELTEEAESLDLTTTADNRIEEPRDVIAETPPVEEVSEDEVSAAPDSLSQNSLEDVIEIAPIISATEQERPTKEGFFARLKRSLVKTRQNLGSGFVGLFRGKKIDDDLFEELEEQLLIADVGVETTRKIIGSLTAQASRKQLKDAEVLYELLKEEMAEILHKVEQPLDVEGKNPFVILMVGVNGVGKTTTIGKLAKQYQSEGKSVMLAAGDTFRAAAVEQLQVWGQRNSIPVVAQHTGADSASVIFDAIQAAKSRGIDVLIADTAGRLQNKSHLMEELKKITRVMGRLDEDAPHEVMLTLDASTGQNAISQAKLFNEAVGLTGITLTKLDGTAKGGVIFSIADQFSIPIRYIGVGEGIDDLRPFQAEDFIEALFARED